MQKQLETIIERYKNSKTTLESYKAISDFVEIIETVPEFIKQVEDEGEEIRLARIELNADKGWNYGLSGRELKEHNKWRARKYDALFQLDSLFPLTNLNHVRLEMQSENIVKFADALFRWSAPDEPMREIDKKEYQGFMDKLYKKIIQFLEKEKIAEEIEAEVVLPKEKEVVEEVTTEIILPEYKSVVAGNFDFDSEKSILHIGNHKITISKRQNSRTTGHFILKHIINSDDEISREYSFCEIAKAELDDDYEKPDSWRKYHHACEYTNEQIRKVSGIDDFLAYTTGKTGEVKINEKYLQ